VDTSSEGLATALPQMQEREERRSRDGGRLLFVLSGHVLSLNR
jgi:hypothetical protein